MKTYKAAAFAAALLALAPFALSAQTAQGAQTADELVRRVDATMNPAGLTVSTLEFRVKGRLSEEYRMTVKTKDNNQKVIVRFLSPPRQVGNDLIMLDRSVWSYDAKSGRIIKIPSNQSFGDTGFSYGDVVRLNLTDNYKGTITKEDGDLCTLKLTAIARDAPYPAIELVVDKTGPYPREAKFFAKNDKLLKTIQYGNVKAINGRLKPTKLTVNLVYDNETVSIMKLEKETLKSYPDHIFNKRVLETRQDEN